MIDLNRFSNTNRKNFFHSSGHAKLDVSSGKSFQERQQLAGNRRAISGYKQARIIAGDRFSQDSKPITTFKDRSAERIRPRVADGKHQTHNAATRSRQAFNSGATPPLADRPQPRHRFQEPMSRGHNPYAS